MHGQAALERNPDVSGKKVASDDVDEMHIYAVCKMQVDYQYINALVSTLTWFPLLDLITRWQSSCIHV